MNGITEVTFEIESASERDAVIDALVGRGKPVGVRAARTEGNVVTVTVDVASTPLVLVRHLVAIEQARSQRCERGSDDATLVSRAIADPQLDRTRTIEYHVPELA